MKHTVYLEGGSIFDIRDRIIENPAILLDKDDGCVHGYGNITNVKAKFIKYVTAYNNAGFPGMADSLLLLDFSNAYFKGLTNEETCYILRRATEHTATSFQPALCEWAQKTLTEDNKNTFKTWLQSEMKKLPLNLYEKEWVSKL